VTQALAENQQSLDQADTYNQNHGSNMVQTFQTITTALEKKKTSSPGTALAYAAKALERSADSGSSRLYAQNLSRAAADFKGKKMDAQGAMQLLQTLIGGQAPASSGGASGGDLLGSLLGGMTGGQTPTQSSEPSGGDLLGSLLGGMTGGQTPTQSSEPSGGDLLGSLLGGGSSGGGGLQDGLDLQDLLTAGMAFMQAKQSGGSTMQALVQAFTSASGMGNAQHRQESTQLVVQSFLQALAGGKR